MKRRFLTKMRHRKRDPKMRIGFVIFTMLKVVVHSVEIYKLGGPDVFEINKNTLTDERAVLDCDFDYDESEKFQLDIKWYFGDEPVPIAQWVPAQMDRPQIISEKFSQFVDIDYAAPGETDPFKKFRVLALKNPTVDLAGFYTCKVSTFVDEDVRKKKLVVYSPASAVIFEQRRLLSGSAVNVTCTAKDVYPLPRVRLTWGHFQLDDSTAHVERSPPISTQNGRIPRNNAQKSNTEADSKSPLKYTVIVHRVIQHDELPSESTLGCELSIPGTDYLVREEAIYRHRGGRYSNPQSQKSLACGMKKNVFLPLTIFLLLITSILA